MKLNKAQQIGVGAGLLGTIAGCTSWIIILGLALGDWVLTVISVATGLLCFFSSLWFFRIRPERLMGISGLIGLWLVMLNGIVLNVYYDKIPESISGISTGKTLVALFQMNFFIIVLGLFASFGIIRDLLKKEG